ncbi:MAG: site-specific integrase [Clostridia bacterium]
MAQVVGKGSIVAQEQPERTCRKWQLRVSIGRDYVTKKYLTKTRRFEGTKTQAQKEMRAFINELESGIRTDTQNLAFGEFAEQWRQERVMSGEIALGTQRKDEYHLRTISKHIGGVRLVDINAETVSSLYIVLRNGGSVSGKPLSGTGLSGIAITFKQVMSEAVRRDIILRNPCDKVKSPKKDTKEKEALSENEARRLICLLTEGEPDNHRTGALLALTCGLRREEVLGLRWCDYNRKAQTITINHALPQDGVKLKEPKSAAGKRTIPLDNQTCARLEAWRVVQASELLKMGLSQDAKRSIIANKFGGFMQPENFSRWWKGFSFEHGFDITLHQLRHTFATMLVSNGVDIITAKTLMGHSDAGMLTKIYAHCVPDNITKATGMLGGILYGKAEKTPIIAADFVRTA